MAWQASALCPEALASGCRHAVAAAPKVTAASRHSPVQTHLKHARFPGQHAHIYAPAVAAGDRPDQEQRRPDTRRQTK